MEKYWFHMIKKQLTTFYSEKLPSTCPVRKFTYGSNFMSVGITLQLSLLIYNNPKLQSHHVIT